MDLLRETLRRCGLFRGLDERSLELLEQTGRVVRFRKGERLFDQGAECAGIFCVSAGLVRVYKLSPAGKEHILHFAGPGTTVAEIAVVGGFNYPASAEAIEDSTCVLLAAEPFRRLLRVNHEVCHQFVTGMALWVRQLIGLLEDIVLRDATGRVAAFLLRADASGGARPFALPMLKKDLASHLNLTSETLSRTLRRLAELALIELHDDQRVMVHDSAALREVAQGIAPGEFAR